MSKYDYTNEEILDLWMDQKGFYHQEERALKSLVMTIGYDNLEDFFQDNPGIISVILNWICNENSPEEWLSEIRNSIDFSRVVLEDDEEDDEDEED